MAKKMKNGLFRIQCYLTESAFKVFNKERELYNQNEEKNKLSESGFCQLKLTGTVSSFRGAPKGNKNAAGPRAKKRISDAEKALALHPKNINGARREETLTRENLSTLIPELPSEKSSSQNVNVAPENELPDVPSTPENRDELSANLQKNPTRNDCDYDAKEIPVSCENFPSENDESENGKLMWADDDFDELFDIVDDLDGQIKAENYGADKDPNFRLEKASESELTDGSQLPNTERLVEQPLLF